MSKHTCEYPDGVCGGDERHRVVITILYLVNQRIKQVSLQNQNSEPDSPARKVLLSGKVTSC